MSPLLPELTVLLAADPVAQAGTDHLLAALVSEPALSVTVGCPGVRAARPCGGGLETLPRMRGGHHHSPRIYSWEGKPGS